METNNELLAEFLGIEMTTDGISQLYYTEDRSLRQIPKFQTDWNWLMQVVEKIEGLNFAIKVVVNEALIFCEDWQSLDYIYAREKTKIKAVYNACVEFIKWYNNESNN